MIRRLAAAVFIGLAAVPLRGAETSLKHVQRLRRAPVSEEILRVRLPRPKELKLANGLTVLVLEQHKLPTVAFSLWIKTGSLSDPKDLPGLASVAARMLREGTTSRDSARLAADVDEIGAGLEASAPFGQDVSRVSASGLAEHADRLVELMADIVLRPAFSPEELEKLRKRLLAELEEERSSPQHLAEERLMRALYGDFPAAVISATPESAKAFTSESLKEFHGRYYRPENAVLGVVGDVKTDEVLSLVRKHLGAWTGPASPAPDHGSVPAPGPAPIILVDRPGSVQTTLMAGAVSLRRADPDFIPLTVLNRVLGGGPSARLFLNLREEKGYTYGAYSWFTADIYPGPWSASSDVRTAVTDGALHELLGEIRRIREEKVPQDELAEARRAIVARFALSLERPEVLLDYSLTAKYFGLPEGYWDRYPEEVMAVGQDQAQRAAAKYLGRLQIVAVGDAKAIKGTLKKFGEVLVYDAEGRRIE